MTKKNKPKKEYTLKPGQKVNRLTPDEKIFIRDNCLTMTDQAIADHLGRFVSTISNYRKKHINLHKGVAGKVEGVTTEDIKPDLTEIIEDEKLRLDLYKLQFVKSTRGRDLKPRLSEKDFNYFGDQWAAYHLQFDDMEVSEKDLLENLILLQIRIRNNQSASNQCDMIMTALTKDLPTKGSLDPENQKDLMIIETLQGYNAQQIQLNKEFKELNEQLRQVMGDFNGTRKQREEKQKIGATTFFDKVKEFNKEEVRRRMGRVNELMKESVKRKEEQFKQPHRFMDGSIDTPITDGADVKVANTQVIEPELTKDENEDGSSDGN